MSANRMQVRVAPPIYDVQGAQFVTNHFQSYERDHFRHLSMAERRGNGRPSTGSFASLTSS